MEKYRFEPEPSAGSGDGLVVRRAQRLSDGLLVVCKAVGARTSNKDAQRRVLDAFRVIKSFDNPHILAPLDLFFSGGGSLNVVTPLVVPGSAPFLNAENASTSAPEDSETHYLLQARALTRVGAQLASALLYLHSRRLVHGNVKPSNILLKSDWPQAVELMKCADPACAAKLARLAEAGRTYLVDTGAFDVASTKQSDGDGCNAYSPPEYIRGKAKELTSSGDIWSFGATLLALGTGHVIGRTKRDREKLRKEGWMFSLVMADMKTYSRKAWERLGTPLQSVVMECLLENAKHRSTSKRLVSSPVFSSVLEEDSKLAQTTIPNAAGGAGAVPELDVLTLQLSALQHVVPAAAAHTPLPPALVDTNFKQPADAAVAEHKPMRPPSPPPVKPAGSLNPIRVVARWTGSVLSTFFGLVPPMKEEARVRLPPSAAPALPSSAVRAPSSSAGTPQAAPKAVKVEDPADNKVVERARERNVESLLLSATDPGKDARACYEAVAAVSQLAATYPHACHALLTTSHLFAKVLRLFVTSASSRTAEAMQSRRHGPKGFQPTAAGLDATTKIMLALASVSPVAVAGAILQSRGPCEEPFLQGDGSGAYFPAAMLYAACPGVTPDPPSPLQLIPRLDLFLTIGAEWARKAGPCCVAAVITASAQAIAQTSDREAATRGLKLASLLLSTRPDVSEFFEFASSGQQLTAFFLEQDEFSFGATCLAELLKAVGLPVPTVWKELRESSRRDLASFLRLPGMPKKAQDRIHAAVLARLEAVCAEVESGRSVEGSTVDAFDTAALIQGLWDRANPKCTGEVACARTKAMLLRLVRLQPALGDVLPLITDKKIAGSIALAASGELERAPSHLPPVPSARLEWDWRSHDYVRTSRPSPAPPPLLANKLLRLCSTDTLCWASSPVYISTLIASLQKVRVLEAAQILSTVAARPLARALCLRFRITAAFRAVAFGQESGTLEPETKKLLKSLAVQLRICVTEHCPTIGKLSDGAFDVLSLLDVLRTWQQEGPTAVHDSTLSFIARAVTERWKPQKTGYLENGGEKSEAGKLLLGALSNLLLRLKRQGSTHREAGPPSGALVAEVAAAVATILGDRVETCHILDSEECVKTLKECMSWLLLVHVPSSAARRAAEGMSASLEIPALQLASAYMKAIRRQQKAEIFQHGNGSLPTAVIWTLRSALHARGVDVVKAVGFAASFFGELEAAIPRREARASIITSYGRSWQQSAREILRAATLKRDEALQAPSVRLAGSLMIPLYAHPSDSCAASSMLPAASVVLTSLEEGVALAKGQTAQSVGSRVSRLLLEASVSDRGHIAASLMEAATMQMVGFEGPATVEDDEERCIVFACECISALAVAASEYPELTAAMTVAYPALPATCSLLGKCAAVSDGIRLIPASLRALLDVLRAWPLQVDEERPDPYCRTTLHVLLAALNGFISVESVVELVFESIAALQAPASVAQDFIEEAGGLLQCAAHHGFSTYPAIKAGLLLSPGAILSHAPQTMKLTIAAETVHAEASFAPPQHLLPILTHACSVTEGWFAQAALGAALPAAVANSLQAVNFACARLQHTFASCAVDAVKSASPADFPLPMPADAAILGLLRAAELLSTYGGALASAPSRVVVAARLAAQGALALHAAINVVVVTKRASCGGLPASAPGHFRAVASKSVAALLQALDAPSLNESLLVASSAALCVCCDGCLRGALGTMHPPTRLAAGLQSGVVSLAGLPDPVAASLATALVKLARVDNVVFAALLKNGLTASLRALDDKGADSRLAVKMAASKDRGLNLPLGKQLPLDHAVVSAVKRKPLLLVDFLRWPLHLFSNLALTAVIESIYLLPADALGISGVVPLLLNVLRTILSRDRAVLPAGARPALLLREVTRALISLGSSNSAWTKHAFTSSEGAIVKLVTDGLRCCEVAGWVPARHRIFSCRDNPQLLLRLALEVAKPGDSGHAALLAKTLAWLMRPVSCPPLNPAPTAIDDKVGSAVRILGLIACEEISSAFEDLLTAVGVETFKQALAREANGVQLRTDFLKTAARLSAAPGPVHKSTWHMLNSLGALAGLELGWRDFCDMFGRHASTVDLRPLERYFVPPRRMGLLENYAGSGGFATVHRCALLPDETETSTIPGRPVTIVKLTKNNDREKCLRQLQEASILAELTSMRSTLTFEKDRKRLREGHVALLAVTFAQDGSLAIFLEAFDGDVQHRMMQSHDEELTMKSRLAVAACCARAVATLHEHGISHCDIKPDNFLYKAASIGEQTAVTRALPPSVGSIVLADFGCAVRREASRFAGEGGHATADSADLQGALAGGTIHYWAPEMVAAMAAGMPTKPSAEADVYALAISMAAVLRRNSPFRGQLEAKEEEALATIHEKGLRDPEGRFALFSWHTTLTGGKRPSLPDDTPAEAVALLQRCWDNDPTKRPTSAELAERLEAIVARLL